jgi:hypothetical protein
MGCSSSAVELSTGQLQLNDCQVLGYERLQGPCSCIITQAENCSPAHALRCDWDVHIMGGGDDWPTSAYYILRESEKEISLISQLGLRVAMVRLAALPENGENGTEGLRCLARDATDGYHVQDGSGAPWCRMAKRKCCTSHWVMREARTNNALWMIDHDTRRDARLFRMEESGAKDGAQSRSRPEEVATWAKLPLATTSPQSEWRDKEVHMGKGMSPAVALSALAVMYLVESGRG